MRKAVIADTSCLILLEKIGELALLNKLYQQVLITPDIHDEFHDQLPDWILVRQPVDKRYQEKSETTLDRGEASAIALALELPGCLLIMDDLRGRNHADRLGIKLTGTLGVIIAAKLNGCIPSVKPLIKKIKATNFRLTPVLEEKILEKANEDQ